MACEQLLVPSSTSPPRSATIPASSSGVGAAFVEGGQQPGAVGGDDQPAAARLRRRRPTRRGGRAARRRPPAGVAGRDRGRALLRAAGTEPALPRAEGRPSAPGTPVPRAGSPRSSSSVVLPWPCGPTMAARKRRAARRVQQLLPGDPRRGGSGSPGPAGRRRGYPAPATCTLPARAEQDLPPGGRDGDRQPLRPRARLGHHLQGPDQRDQLAREAEGPWGRGRGTAGCPPPPDWRTARSRQSPRPDPPCPGYTRAAAAPRSSRASSSCQAPCPRPSRRERRRSAVAGLDPDPVFISLLPRAAPPPRTRRRCPASRGCRNGP